MLYFTYRKSKNIMKQKFYSIGAGLAIFIIIAIVAVYLLLIANGYKINYKTKSLELTGLIYLDSQPNSNLDVFVDDEKKATKTPFKLNNLSPSRYAVKISKSGYQDWNKTFTVEPGKTSSKEKIKLFFREPKQLTITDDEKKSFNDMISTWPPKGLSIKNSSEIWLNDSYLTRFSQEILQLTWHPDLDHIIFQLAKQIRIIDLDGSNNIKLVDLDFEKKSDFILVNNNILLYRDGDDINKIQVQ